MFTHLLVDTDCSIRPVYRGLRRAVAGLGIGDLPSHTVGVGAWGRGAALGWGAPAAVIRRPAIERGCAAAAPWAVPYRSGGGVGPAVLARIDLAVRG